MGRWTTALESSTFTWLRWTTLYQTWKVIPTLLSHSLRLKENSAGKSKLYIYIHLYRQKLGERARRPIVCRVKLLSAFEGKWCMIQRIQDVHDLHWQARWWRWDQRSLHLQKRQCFQGNSCYTWIHVGFLFPLLWGRTTIFDKCIIMSLCYFHRHPVMAKWPVGHNWFFMKLELIQVWLQDWIGGISLIPLEDYFKATPFWENLSLSPSCSQHHRCEARKVFSKIACF